MTQKRGLEVISDSYHRFLVIVSIPLLDNMNIFEIFNICNMPVAVNDTVVPTDKLPNMVAWYIL